MSAREVVKVSTGQIKTDLQPELNRERKFSWEHKYAFDPHFDANTFEMPGGNADREAAMMMPIAPAKPRKKKK